MAPARQQLMTARETERFPTEWGLYDGVEHECEQASHQSEDDRPGGRGLSIAHRDDQAPGPPVRAAWPAT